MKQNINFFNLVWIVDGKIKETLLKNKSFGICKWRKDQLEKSTHKTGLLQIRNVNQKV